MGQPQWASPNGPGQNGPAQNGPGVLQMSEGRFRRMKRNAMYPGTCDPITNGHHDLVRRAASIFNRVVVAIAANPNKAPMFPLEARVDMARRVLHDLPNVEGVGYSGLPITFVRN